MFNPIVSIDTSLADKKPLEVVSALEKGSVIFLPHTTFPIDHPEIFAETLIPKKSKNISYNPQTKTLKGLSPDSPSHDAVQALLKNYAAFSTELLAQISPEYAKYSTMGRTSFRPVEVKHRKSSYRKDDTRLHVDAFVATPVHNYRILRVFCNVNPHGMPRVWHLGESFSAVAHRFYPQASKYRPVIAKALAALKITKKLRTPYDHYMLQIHDNMKKDMHYQREVEKIRFDFPAKSTWIVFSDQASHAALSGQHLLEQTFYLPVEHMHEPAHSPLKILEGICGHTLVDL
jgi:hypothetical protein